MADYAKDTVKSGEIAGAISATQMPVVPCNLVRFKAPLSNAGNVYIGGSAVTKPDGATDITTGLELAPGDDTGWIPVSNVGNFYRICDNVDDDLVYLALL